MWEAKACLGIESSQHHRRAVTPVKKVCRQHLASHRGHGGIIRPSLETVTAKGGFKVMPSNPDVTMLLQAWREGDNQALERLVPLVRTEIHRLAGVT